MLASCNQSEPVMVNVSPKDMERTGDRYYGDWEQMEARTVSSLKGYKKTDIPVGRYGDRTDIQFEETGFYYTKKVEGKWWAVSPDGYPLISLGINALNLNLEEKVMNVFNEKYGSPEKWLDETVPMLEKYGFNGAGSWVDVEQVRSYNERNDARFSYCPILYLVTNYKSTLDESRGYNADKKLLPVFGQGFEEYCEMRAGELSEMKNDPNLFGYFFDK